MVDNQEGTFEKRWDKSFEKMQVLKAEWMITRKCNLKCSYCKIRDSRTLKAPELSTEALVKIVQLFSRNWPGAPMVVYGGEPTERDDLPELLRAGRLYRVKLPVISNSIRVVEDSGYARLLVESGLENWSVSLDGLAYMNSALDMSGRKKSLYGLMALRLFRDIYGLRDLVACVTVNRKNIRYLPDILRALTSEGIHSIFTPLHIGGPGYEYAQGNVEDLPLQEDLDEISPLMYEMVKSGRFLCSNDAAWFNVWPKHFRKQDWMCNDKGLLTIDADGSLKYCVDIPFREEDRMNVFELNTETGQKKFLDIIQKGPPCKGCLWNPAYECIKRARDPHIGIESGRERSRHYVAEERLELLHGGAGRYFEGNPELKRVPLGGKHESD